MPLLWAPWEAGRTVSSFPFDTETHRYTVSEGEHSGRTYLWVTPIGNGLCKGTRVSETELVASVSSEWDAWKVAQLHKAAHK